MTRFLDRREAGLALGGLLSDRSFVHPVVLGLPRGGVPVAAEVARLIDAPLDVPWCGSWACQGTKSSRWVRSARADRSCSTAR